MNMLEIIDAHMHLWDLGRHRYPWLQEKAREMWIGDYEALKKSYLIDDYLNDTRGCNVVRSIHLQAQMAGPPAQETQWLDSCSKEARHPLGIVAFCDFSSDDAERVIEQHLQYAGVTGIRQDLNWHEDPFYRFCESPSLMTDPKWRCNFKLLEKHGLSFDLQIYAAHQSEEAYELVKDHENTTFILNHSGAPYDTSREGMEAWLKGLRRLAELPNVYTKLSGFDMYDHHWTVQSLADPVRRVVECFGTDRCLFASNFPVSSLYRSYSELLDAHKTIHGDLSEDEQTMIFYGNAKRAYRQ